VGLAAVGRGLQVVLSLANLQKKLFILFSRTTLISISSGNRE
jgi:hypothetical protein